MSLQQTLAPWKERWNNLADQEKRMLLLVGALVAAAVLWLQILAPARATLRTADAQAKILGAQLQQMQQLQSQAQALQKQPAIGFDAALKALGAATQDALGNKAQITSSAEHATITIKDVTADALAQWLVQARINARSVPLEAQLTRSASGGVATWNGVLLMSLPARSSP